MLRMSIIEDVIVRVKDIPETRRAHKLDTYMLYYYHWINASSEGLLVHEGIIRPVDSVSVPFHKIYLLLNLKKTYIM
jgi:hypothetical protein